MRTALAATVAAFLFVSVAAASSSTAIVPGAQVGPFRIGMEMAAAREAMASFGEIDEETTASGLTYCNPVTVGVCVYDYVIYGDEEPARTPGRAAWISTDDPRFDYAGQRVGGSVVPYREGFGPPDYLTVIGPGLGIAEWHTSGIAVVFDVRGTVRAIIVFLPKRPRT